jgi:nucleotide-binding universal stress UspA family protein
MQQAEQQRGPRLVVVGVDGSPGSVEAAQFAADEAALRRLDLLVVHAVTPGSGRTVRGVRDADGVAERRARGQVLLDDALSRVRVAPRTMVHKIVEAAPAGALLSAWTGGAALLVLGQHQFDLNDGRVAGQVAPTVVANARCPVVVVPADWTRTVVRTAHLGVRPVVVGVGGRGSATAALRLAYEEAELRRAPVVILHASTRAGPAIDGRAAREGTMAEVAASRDHEHPDVATNYRIVPVATISTWVDATSGASLMILGRPFSLRGRRSWKHSVAHAMLHQARCPLVVVPPSAPWAVDSPSAGIGALVP